jgi:methylmalonyl-CoA/ethylmalonyl-CoA epimerase
MEAATPGISRIGQIAIPAQDVARAEAFYKEALGLPHLFSVGGMAFFDCGGTRLMLDGNQRSDGQPARHSSILYFLVSEIEPAFAGLRQRGVKIVHPPHRVARMPDHELWMGFFEDSEGNTLSLMSEVRPPA